MKNKSKELEVAIKAALAAGEVLDKYFKEGMKHEIKDDKSAVTLGDTESEIIIKKIIGDAFPDHSIIAEETGHTKNNHAYTWYVDPVDGTRNFARGVPLFAVSIALADGDKLLLGVVYNPVTKSLYFGEAGKGAYLNDKRIFISRNELSKSMMTANRGKTDHDEKLFRELLYLLPKNVVPSIRDFGCTALDISFVAQGALDACITLGLKSYDFAASVL
ncbi:MAG TPA: inositol monophosphatase family protein, partial [Candidatus Paceibacterota bacterium]|nr:inositol monophosphatase family protein [Candidatus Paceibacterota bacterium]